MATLVIRNIEEGLHARLKQRATAAGRSMEEEVRNLLRESLEAEPVPPDTSLWSGMRALFEPLGGVELDIERQPGQRPPPDFSGPEWDLDDEAGTEPPR
jgi:antitoxin FitA